MRYVFLAFAGLAVAIALANKMARSAWAMLSKGQDYRGSALAPA